MTRESIINELVKRGYKAEPYDTIKNSVLFEGIRILTSENVAIVIYSEPIIERAIRNGKSLDDVMKEVLRIYEKNKDKKFDTEKFSSREFVIHNIMIGLQRTGTEILIKRATEFDGIESYLYLRVNQCDGEEKSIKIKPEHLEVFGIDEEEAWKYAEKNTFAETEIVSMSLLFEFITELDNENELFIVSNSIRTNGASAILNKEAIREISEKIGVHKWIVLPSSIHEMLIKPYSESCDVEYCSEVVASINENQVKPSERLTNKAYVIEV